MYSAAPPHDRSGRRTRPTDYLRESERLRLEPLTPPGAQRALAGQVRVRWFKPIRSQVLKPGSEPRNCILGSSDIAREYLTTGQDLPRRPCAIPRMEVR